MGTKTTFGAVARVDNDSPDFLFNVSAGVGDAIAFGDLMYNAGSDIARPADKMTTLGTEALDQAQFAAVFLGIAAEQILSTETNTTKRFTLRRRGVRTFNCPSQTWNKGDLVGVYSNGTTLDPQQVDKVTTPMLAIGKVAKYYSSATTTVEVEYQSRYVGDIGAADMQFPGLLSGQGAGVTAMSDTNTTLTVASNPFQTMTPTADRTVTLPAVAQSKGMGFVITNLATNLFYLNVKNAGGTFIGIVGPGETCLFLCDGATWKGIDSETGAGGNMQIPSAQIVTKTDAASPYTVLATDSGTSFDNTGAAGSLTFTFPAVASSKGFYCNVYGVVDQAIVLSFPSGTLVGPNNAGRTSYTSAGAGNRIGVSHYVYCNGAKWFLLVDLKGLTIGTYA